MSASGTDDDFLNDVTSDEEERNLNSNSSSEADSGEDDSTVRYDDLTGSEHLTIRKALDESETDPATHDPVHFAACQAAYKMQQASQGTFSNQRMAAIVNKIQLNLNKKGEYKPGSCSDARLRAVSQANPKSKRRVQATLISAANPSDACGNPPSAEVVELQRIAIHSHKLLEQSMAQTNKLMEQLLLQNQPTPPEATASSIAVDCQPFSAAKPSHACPRRRNKVQKQIAKKSRAGRKPPRILPNHAARNLLRTAPITGGVKYPPPVHSDPPPLPWYYQ